MSQFLKHFSSSCHQVYATDRDAGENGRVEYSMEEDTSGFFAVDRHSGWITVARPMAEVTF